MSAPQEYDRSVRTRTSRFGRRTLLGGSAALAGAGIAGVGGSLLPPRAYASGPGSKDWSKLKRSLEGSLLRPGDSGYVGAVKTFDPRRDGQRPLAVVRAASTADVIQAIKFTTKFELKPRPRSGGHSYVGASTGNGVLVIDVGRMKQIIYRSDKSVSIGAGVRLGELHDALEKHGRTVPTGTCPTVGAAGLTLGGGIGVETRLYGLTQDALTQGTIVTADGVSHHPSSNNLSDLLWAMRGGGGGNFGIATWLRYETKPALPGEIFRLRWPAKDAHKVLVGWQERLADQPRHRWANLHLDSSGGTVTPSITGVVWDGSASKEIKAIVSAVGVSPSSKQIWHESHAGAMNWFAGGSAGSRRQSWYAGSDVVGHKVAGARATKVIKAVGSWDGHGSVAAIFDPFGGAVTDHSVGSTAFAWRKAHCDVQWYCGLTKTGRKNIAKAAAWLGRCHNAIGSASVGGYVNYLEPDRDVADYYGDNYDKLVKINKLYDPHNVFSSKYSLPG